MRRCNKPRPRRAHPGGWREPRRRRAGRPCSRCRRCSRLRSPGPRRRFRRRRKFRRRRRSLRPTGKSRRGSSWERKASLACSGCWSGSRRHRCCRSRWRPRGPAHSWCRCSCRRRRRRAGRRPRAEPANNRRRGRHRRTRPGRGHREYRSRDDHRSSYPCRCPCQYSCRWRFPRSSLQCCRSSRRRSPWWCPLKSCSHRWCRSPRWTRLDPIGTRARATRAGRAERRRECPRDATRFRSTASRLPARPRARAAGWCSRKARRGPSRGPQQR